LERIAGEGRHQGVVARLKGSGTWDERDLDELLHGLEDAPFLLILDGVQDPRNLGACLRGADAAGVHAVIVPRDRSAGLSPTVSKVACGAVERVPLVRVTNLARTLKRLREQHGVWLVGTSGDAEQSLYALDLRGPLGIVMGAEGEGMRRLTREACDHLVHLPMRGGVESLNVSVASGICLYEALRQRDPVGLGG
jgi:23S rRNA (guanosine2251-2'-O)-methyltransferase